MIEKNDVNQLAKRLSGLNTIPTICRKLGVKEKTAINYVCELRKKGLVKTTRGMGKIRLYKISPVKAMETGYPGLYGTINKYSPLKLVEPYEHRVYHKMSVEEAVVRALETGDFRTILASMPLFRHVKSWPRLYLYAKKEGVRRQVGALYDLSRTAMRIRRIDRRTRNSLLAAKEKNRFMVSGVRTKDFPEIEKKWKVCIPFTKGDLRRLKE